MGDIFGNTFGGNPPSINIPAFTSSGAGLTPDEQALNQYTYGEDLLGLASDFGKSGTGQSTMATQAATGAKIGEAEQAGKISDINQTAQYDAYKNAVNSWIAQLSNQSTLTQLANANAGEFAKSAGKAFGLTGG
jgi:hypothetical protein